MQLTLGLFVILILVVFPGLLFRRLYFYGEFSKQFGSNLSLFNLLSRASIPGLVILIVIFLFYDTFITSIDLGEVIDKFKDVNNPNHRFKKSDDTPIKYLIGIKSSPFIGFLYLTNIAIGLSLGRLVRNLNLDIKVKFLRFKNYWFYLFNGHAVNFNKKKLPELNRSNQKHYLTNADVLIDTENGTHLYSGIVADYEIKEDDNQRLQKIMLSEAKRYKIVEGEKKLVPIPGNLFVVDCTTLRNINLIYVYTEKVSWEESKWPPIIQRIFNFIAIGIIPLFIFQSDSISYGWYQMYFEFNWITKISTYLLFVETLHFLNPFVERDDKYKFWYKKRNVWVAKILLICIFLIPILLSI